MSIKVEFKGIGPGKCRWCKKESKEVIELAFGDGSFVGRYCFADFKKALEDKLENEEQPKPVANAEQTAKADPVVTAARVEQKAEAKPAVSAPAGAGNGPAK